MKLEPQQCLQVRLGGDDCTCHELGPFMGFSFVVPTHSEDEPCTAAEVNVTYGSSADTQTLVDGDYIVKHAEDDIAGYPADIFERLFDHD